MGRRKKKCKEATLGKLNEAFVKICKRQNMSVLDVSEVSSLCLLLETRGFFTVKQNKNNRESKVSLRIDEKEVETALQDKHLLAEIIREKSCVF